jgi:hypothetical protein
VGTVSSNVPSCSNTMELLIQDYAGQSQYYTTNQLFMNGSLGTFVVVAQAMKVMNKNVQPEPPREPNLLRDILSEWDYWLRYISAIYPSQAKAHVILALTHLDEKHGRLLSAYELKSMDEWYQKATKRYGNIRFHTLIHLNYDHPERCSELRKALVTACQAVCAAVYVPVTFQALLVRMERLEELKRQEAMARKKQHLPLITLEDLYGVAHKVLQRKPSILRRHKASEPDAFSRNATMDVQELSREACVASPRRKQQGRNNEQTLLLMSKEHACESDEKKTSPDSSNDNDAHDAERKQEDGSASLSSNERAVRYLHGCGAIWSSELGTITASEFSPFAILQPMSWFT